MTISFNLDRIKRFKFAKVIFFAVRGFRDDRCDLRASALTLFTLLSIVPVMAMAFGIAKGFGFERRLHSELLDKFSAQQEVVEQVIGGPDSGGVATGTGSRVGDGRGSAEAPGGGPATAR